MRTTYILYHLVMVSLHINALYDPVASMPNHDVLKLLNNYIEQIGNRHPKIKLAKHFFFPVKRKNFIDTS